MEGHLKLRLHMEFFYLKFYLKLMDWNSFFARFNSLSNSFLIIPSKIGNFVPCYLVCIYIRMLNVRRYSVLLRMLNLIFYLFHQGCIFSFSPEVGFFQGYICLIWDTNF